MLDQNTDRMWYVIGAVIVGAALIFILNGTMPELFASVGEMFESKAEETTEIVDGIGPVVQNENLLTVDSLDLGASAQSNFHELDTLATVDLHIANRTNNGWGTGGIILRQSKVNFKPSTRYLLSFSYRKTAGNLYSFGGHVDNGISLRTDVKTTVDGLVPSYDYNDLKSMYGGNDTQLHTVSVEFTTSSHLVASDAMWIQPNRGTTDEDTSIPFGASKMDVSVELYDLRLEEVR